MTIKAKDIRRAQRAYNKAKRAFENGNLHRQDRHMERVASFMYTRRTGSTPKGATQP